MPREICKTTILRDGQILLNIENILSCFFNISKWITGISNGLIG
jgi:hypothetical protein